MDIEPLKTIMSYSNDKKDTLLNSNPKKSVREKVIKLEYEDESFYINDKIYCIKRNTLELEYIGRIYCIDDDSIGIKLSNVRNVNINPDLKYYIFVKLNQKI